MEKLGLEILIENKKFQPAVNQYVAGLAKMQATTDKLVRGSVTVKDAEGNMIRYSTSTANAAAATDKASMSWQQAALKAAAFAAAMGVAQKLQQFTTDSFNAARAQNDVKGALVQTVGSLAEYNKLIEGGRQATKGMASETQLAQAGLVYLKAGIAGNSEEVGRLAAAGGALVNTYSALGASQEKLTRFILTGNRALLDNFNFTKQQIDAKAAEIEATEGLSGAEAQMAARKALVIQEGEKLLGTVSNETVQVAQATAGWEDFTASFGQLLIALNTATGALPSVISLFGRLTEGAKAWGTVFEGVAALTAQNRAATEASGAERQYQEALAGVDHAASNAIRAANQIAEARRSASANAVKAAQDELAALGPVVSSLDAMGFSAAGAAEAHNPLIRGMIAASQAARDEALAMDLSRAAIERKNQAAGLSPSTNREAEAYKQLALARAGTVESQAAFQKKVEEDRIKDQQKAQAASFKEMTKDFKSATTDMANTISSVLKPSLSEVWSPPEGTEVHIDEWARRMATVATDGFGSDWLTELNTQFAGQDFFQPIIDAMGTGDPSALKNAATSLLTTGVENLWDVEVIKQKVRDTLQSQNLRQQIIDTVQQELAAEGTVISPEDIAAIATGTATLDQSASGASQAVGAIAADAGTTQTALDTLGLSLDTISNTNIPGLITKTGDLVLAIKGIGPGITEASPEIVSALSTTVEDLQTVITIVKWTDLGKSIDDGILQGIRENQAQVFEVLKAMMREALKQAGDEIGYGSPAKKFIPLGQSVDEGFALGMDSKAGLVSASLAAIIDPLSGGLKDVTGDAIQAASSATQDFVDNFLTNIDESKFDWLRKQMKKVFSDAGMRKAIEGATGQGVKVDLFRNLLPNLDEVGLGGANMASVNSAIGAFLNAYKTSTADLLADQQKQLKDAAQSAVDQAKTFYDFATNAAGQLSGKISDLGAKASDFGGKAQALADLLNTGAGEFEWQGQIISAGHAKELLNQIMIEQTQAIDEQNVALTEQAGIQDELNTLNAAQARLGMLQQQLDLMQQLADAGLSVSDVLGDLQLGPNATTEDIISASTAAILALIDQANNDLALVTAHRGIGLSRGIGFRRGIGFAGGLGLGYTIPSGYPNDSFGPMYAESGEQMLITPRGLSIDELVGSRLGEFMGNAAMAQPVQGTQAVSNRTVNLNIGQIAVSNGMDAGNLISLIQRTAAGLG